MNIWITTLKADFKNSQTPGSESKWPIRKILSSSSSMGTPKSQVFIEELPLRETQRKQTRFFTSEDKKMKAIMKWIKKSHGIYLIGSTPLVQ